VVGVTLRVALELRGNGVRAEKCDRQLQRALLVECDESLEQAQLGGGLQAIAGLGLGSRGAVKEHVQQARPCLRGQGLERGGACRPDRGNNPAAGREDVEIGHAPHLHLEFAGPVSGPDDVGVRVHQTGHDHAAGGVEAPFVGKGCPQLSAGPHLHNLLATHQGSPVLQDAQPPQVVPALGAAAEGD
jgi:hypothetical protein